VASLEQSIAGCICVDGAFFAPDAARVSVRDHGVLFGDGLFETLRTYGGVPFRLDRHLARLGQGLAILGFPPVDLPRLRALTLETIERAALAEAHVRITVTRGLSAQGLDPAGCDAPTVIVSALPLRPHPEHHYAEGIEAIRLWPRHPGDMPPPWVKTTSYQRTVLARAELRRREAQEGFFLDLAGNITEGTVSNVFALSRGVLRTPPTNLCLPGITRAEVIELARKLGGLELREEPLSSSVLSGADEVWVTSSLSEVLPVVRIDGRAVGTGSPGPMAAHLRAAYRGRATPEGEGA
jgi:branched-chain amino acid aminotransferase